MIGLKFLALALVAAPLMMARTGLTGDGEKYLSEAKARVTRIEKTVDADAKDPAKAQADADDLLASKRFLDNVQTEQPKHAEAAVLQKKADVLLKKLEPVLIKKAIAQRLEDLDELIAGIEKDLALATRDAETDESLRGRFDMLRGMVKDVLAKEPANDKALKARDRENALWQTYRTQREASKGGKP